MNGQAAARILLVITLIVTAHAVKPFSVENISTHFLNSTRTIALVLPDSARSGLDHANLLAMTMGNSLFFIGTDIQNWQTLQTSHERLAPAEAVIAMQIQSSTIRKVKAAVRTATVERVVDESRLIALNAARSESDEVELLPSSEPAPATEDAQESISSDLNDADLTATKLFNASHPVALPVLSYNVACALSKVKPVRLERLLAEPRRLELLYVPSKSKCVQQDGRKIKLIALIQEVKRSAFEVLSPANQLASILECEDEGVKVITADEVVEEEAQAVETQASEVMAIPMALSVKDSCPTDPK